jgi:hypothetical protein
MTIGMALFSAKGITDQVACAQNRTNGGSYSPLRNAGRNIEHNLSLW